MALSSKMNAATAVAVLAVALLFMISHWCDDDDLNRVTSNMVVTVCVALAIYQWRGV